MKRFLLSSAAGALALCAFSYGAQATTVLTENFNDAGFNGGTTIGAGDPVGTLTDRVGWSTPNTTFTTINNNDGWNFNGSAFYVTNGAGNGAVYLNEPNGVAYTLQSLPDAAVYSVTFTYWGDNRPESYTGSQANSTYNLFVTVNGIGVGSITDYDRAPGSIPGTVITINGLTTDG